MTKEERKEYHRQWYLKNKEKQLEAAKQHYNDNKELYKEYYNNNKEKIIEYQKSYQKDYQVEYNKTPMARASNLLWSYKQADKNANRGKCTLTAKWIVDNIFSKPCVHCGESDWRKLGCNRINNDLPHTPDNVEPCCFPCNIKLLKMERSNYGKFIKMINEAC